ncbi:MAG: hypothetical protein H7Y30_11520 [Pyrinomonadaceae bacterium]|nr:hypothetical protein [Pyrinomonadaceae bacterium]
MTSGTFPLLSLQLFMLVAVLVPAISYLLLRKELNTLGFDSHKKLKPPYSLFFTRLLIWLAVVIILSFVMWVFLGFFIFVNAHGGAKGNELVPPVPLFISTGIIAIMLGSGWLLHSFTKRRLRQSVLESASSLSA